MYFLDLLSFFQSMGCLSSKYVPCLLFPHFSRLVFFPSVYLLHCLQLEAAWVLTNIAASDYTLLVAECGAVPRLVELLGSSNVNIRHQVKQLYPTIICMRNSSVCDIDILLAPTC